MQPRKEDSPIRVTLVLPRAIVPIWLRNILRCLRSAPFVSLSVVAVLTEQEQHKSSSSLFDVWLRLETTIFGYKIDAEENSEDLVDITNECESKSTGRFSIATLDDLEKSIHQSDTDILVWMLPGRPQARTVSLAKYGTLTIADAFNTTFGFTEFVNQKPTTRCDIAVYGSTPSEDCVLASSFSATDEVLFVRGINRVRAKCEALLIASIMRIWRQADPRVDGIPNDATEPLRRVVPDFLQTAWGLLRFYGRFLGANLTKPFHFDQWQVAYRMGGDRLDQEGLQRLAPAHKGFWADPFVAERDGRKFIFFEEYLPETARGHIAAVEIYADGQISEPVNVLMRDYHFSYPFLFEYDGSLFMIPECAEAGRVEVFRCERFPDRWESHAVLLEGVRAFDPTLVEHDGLWWMFVTIQHDGNTPNDELHLFYAASPFDEWIPHPLNPVRLDVRAARPAGAVFRDNGKLFRPAQDCSGRYGRAISIQEVRRMTPEEYEEVEWRRISAHWAVGADGTHTINQASGVTVYDCEVKCRK